MQTSATTATRAARPNGLTGGSEEGRTVIAAPHTATAESPSSQANRCAVDMFSAGAPRRPLFEEGKVSAKP